MILLYRTLPEIFNSWICEGLKYIWDLIVCLSYWAAMIGGFYFVILCLVTKSKKAEYKLFALILSFIFIMAVNSII